MVLRVSSRDSHRLPKKVAAFSTGGGLDGERRQRFLARERHVSDWHNEPVGIQAPSNHVEETLQAIHCKQKNLLLESVTVCARSPPPRQSRDLLTALCPAERHCRTLTMEEHLNEELSTACHCTSGRVDAAHHSASQNGRIHGRCPTPRARNPDLHPPACSCSGKPVNQGTHARP